MSFLKTNIKQFLMKFGKRGPLIPASSSGNRTVFRCFIFCINGNFIGQRIILAHPEILRSHDAEIEIKIVPDNKRALFQITIEDLHRFFKRNTLFSGTFG